ncbi:hypothetical protein CLV31_12353 [Algoriphagus aquaeductus]|uniref:Uncharacterized protein n=1 Tax=Algoriphagus aquaeductus TaxID=475299 RepID=A0A326RKF6_9BACT|nr:hypothetical protein CLV31_12353 [Algoriphagus aquaeductus]
MSESLLTVALAQISPPDFRAGTPGLKSEKVLNHFLLFGQDHGFS